MPPRTLRSAVVASRTSCCPRSPNVPAGSSSRRSSRPMRPVTSWRVARKADAVTSASKIVNSVAEWASSRHVRRSDRTRFAYQSSGSGAGAGSATAGPGTVRSLLVHRRITVRSYGLEPRAGRPVLPLPVRRLRAAASRPVRDNPKSLVPNEPAACPGNPHARVPGPECFPSSIRAPDRWRDGAASVTCANQCQERGCTLMLGCSRARDRRSSGSPVATRPPPRRIAVATTRASMVWHESSRSR